MNYDQISLFELKNEKKIINKPIRLIELFAGYGSQNLSLKYLGVNYEHYKICEWATKSIQAYNDLHIQDYADYSRDLTKEEIIKRLFNYGISANYNEPMTLEQIKRKGEKWQRLTYNNIIATNNLVNIQNVKADDLEIVDIDKYEYIMTYSFPCQDLSLAGQTKGMKKGDNTRSGLLWEVERLLDQLKNKPQILLMENVPQVIGKKNIKDFQNWVIKLEKLGYSNFVDVINSKDFGIPQNRERCFMVSILGEYSYKFPKSIKLENRLKDLLEKEVDESYFLSEKMINYIVADNEKWTGNNSQSIINKDISSTLNTNEGSRRCDASNYICDDLPNNFDLKIHKSLRETLETNNIEDGSVVDCYNRTIKNSGIINTITTRCDASNNLYIVVPEATKKGYAIAEDGDGIYINRPHQKRGVVQKQMIQTLKTSVDYLGLCVNDISHLRIRKLTPIECFRLMGVKDEDFEKLKHNQSNASLYHLAGDSIVTTCLMALFGELLDINYIEKIKEISDQVKEVKE